MTVSRSINNIKGSGSASSLLDASSPFVLLSDDNKDYTIDVANAHDELTESLIPLTAVSNPAKVGPTGSVRSNGGKYFSIMVF